MGLGFAGGGVDTEVCFGFLLTSWSVFETIWTREAAYKRGFPRSIGPPASSRWVLRRSLFAFRPRNFPPNTVTHRKFHDAVALNSPGLVGPKLCREQPKVAVGWKR